MALGGGDDKTEKPSPRRLEKARREGRIAQSRELASAAALLFAFVTLSAFGGEWVARWGALWSEIARAFPRVATLDPASLEPVRRAVVSLGGLFVPVLAAAAGGALLFGWGQTGLLFSPSLLRPQASRINPASGFARLLSPRNATELLKTLLKASVLAFLSVRALTAFWAEAPFLADHAPRSMGGRVWELTCDLFRSAVIFFASLGVLDYFLERRRVEGELRMTRQEVKDEHREQEGNPQIKSRLRGLMRRWAGRRMMSRVPKADVVVTNPTHLAVALQYTRRMRAPEVVAKGADALALRIREVAAAHGIPVLENKPLAQILYRKVDVGDPVPVGLYQAVAEVLAYVYRLKNRVPGR